MTNLTPGTQQLSTVLSEAEQAEQQLIYVFTRDK